MVDTTALAQEVASISSEVDSMKAILSTKIGANDEIMTTVTDKLGSLTGKLDEFYGQLMENDGATNKSSATAQQLSMITLQRSPTSK